MVHTFPLLFRMSGYYIYEYIHIYVMTYNEYIRNLASYLDNHDTLVPNIKEET